MPMRIGAVWLEGKAEGPLIADPPTAIEVEMRVRDSHCVAMAKPSAH
jgi:hypothetical protein